MKEDNVASQVAALVERIRAVETILTNDVQHLVKALDRHIQSDRTLFGWIFAGQLAIFGTVVTVLVNIL